MDVREAMKALVPHAKDQIKTLEGVWIKNKYAYATDRFTIARIELDGDNVPDQAWIPTSVAKMLVRFLPDGSGLLSDGSSVVLQLPDQKPPAVEKLFDGFEPAESGPASVRFNGVHLGRFDVRHFPTRSKRSLSESPTAVRFEFGSGDRPVIRVTVSEFPEFVGLIMPLRDGD